MARKRMIDPSFWTDEKLGECSVYERMLFMGLISNADDEGRGRASAKLIKATIFPYDDITADEVESCLLKLGNYGMLQLYTVNGQRYYALKNFLKYQLINRPTKSNFPPPDISLTEDSLNTHGGLTEDSRLIEYNRMEHKKNGIENNICPPAEPDGRVSNPKKLNNLDFDLCWKEYPNKKGKDKITKKAFNELDKLGTEKVLEAVRRYKAECEADKRDTQYIQHGSTFFNGGYKDYIGDDYQPPQRRNGDGLPVYDDYDIPF